ncbi:hypothetical protein N7450_005283 [Penicillium hetheringtonii]|uniref:Uncharacterized protein n=1 Tax=Penicillium hetheringtonii TaxID=911720 RepID=A0AAD6DRQ9_9EURO|nr:hypothetical protein N7450_005283 [Penicillium hetheringtonii]
MSSVTSGAVLEKRTCASYGRQFCCAVEEVPNKEILPNLYLFVYGLGCIVADPTFAEEIPDTESCDAASSQPHANHNAREQTGPFGSVFCFTHHA